MATTKKTTKKKKSDGPRSRKYGCVTYNSEPQDNPDCRKGRCSPPARMTSQDGTTKVTQIRYRRRNLDVVSRNCACSLKPASKTKKSTGSKTKKAPAKPKAPVKPKAPAKPKTVKAPTKVKAPTVKKTASKVKAPAKPKTVKAPVRTAVKKTAVPPVKVTPLGRYIDGIILDVPQPIPSAVRTILPTDSVFEWYVRTWPDDDLALEIDHRLKFAQVKKAMGTNAIYRVIGVDDSIVRERIETGIREFYRDGVPINPALAPMAAKKTASKTVKAPAKTPAKTMKDDDAVTIRMSAPLSVQKRALATQRAKVQKKQQAMQQTVDVYDPDSPRPSTPEFIPVLDENKKWVMRRQPKTDKMLPWTFAHVYEKQADDKVRYPQGSVHVVKYKDKFYVAEGNSIISLKKETKDQAFEQAYRLAKERHLDVVAFFKVKGSNPPKFRMQKLQQ